MVLSRLGIIAVLITSSALAAPRPPAKSSKAAAASTAQSWARSLSLRDKVAQLVMVKFYGEVLNPRSRAYRTWVKQVTEEHVGGLVILNRVRYGIAQKAEPHAMAAFLNRVQKVSKLPLIVGGDFERGASMRLNSTTKFPHAMAFGAAHDLQATRELGRITAREARAIGVHWVFAPDADVNNNPDNPIINIRSFSEDPQDVAAHVKAFIEGARSDPKFHVLTTVKHFPGHGDTATDTHMGLGRITADRERLNTMELVPFRAAIESGVDSVMSAHIAVSAVEQEEIPATVSKAVLTGLLRTDLGFRGLVTTDAMDMQGLTKMYRPGEAAVRAIEAGVDLLLIPENPRAAIDGVVAAVKSGRLSEKRINESLLRILNAKVHIGLNRSRLVKLDQVEELVDAPEDEDLAQRVAQKALTLVRNEGNLLPLQQPASTCFYVLPSSRFSTQGREFADEVRRLSPTASVTMLDPQLPLSEFDALISQARNCSAVVVAAYVTSAAYRGDVALAGNYPSFVENVAKAKPTALLAFGNPYLLRSFPGVAAYLATFSTVEPTELATAKALFGQVPVTGRLPVTIPGFAKRGEGIDLPGGATAAVPTRRPGL